MDDCQIKKRFSGIYTVSTNDNEQNHTPMKRIIFDAMLFEVEYCYYEARVYATLL